MEIIPLSIPDVKLLIPKKFGDHRGFFAETYSRQLLTQGGIDVEFVQDNHSMSAASGTVRGLHYQTSPHAQGKLIRVLRGAIMDVAVDIRKNSPTFGKWVAERLDQDNFRMMYVPVGFAHGFITLEAYTEVAYKVTDYYAPTHERAVRWNDPKLNIPWGIAETNAALSAKDKIAPLWDEVADWF